MREIMFRGKHLYGNSSREWLYGYYADEDSYGCDFPCILPLRDESEVVDYSVDQKTVGQYVGCSDSDDRLIFEGDILDFYGSLYVVDYDDRTAQFVICPVDKNLCEMGFDEFYAHSSTVVGNIHDNPELLEADHE